MATYEPFIGHADVTYRSDLKTWMSVALGNTYLKLGETFLTKHPDDLETVSDENPGWWPLEEAGYRCVSLPSTLCFDPFLSYKIERDVVGELESDTIHGLSLISSDPRSLSSFSVLVEPQKLDYLRRSKAGSLEGAGLAEVSSDEFAAQILDRIHENYIYELAHSEEHDTSKFNIILEFASGSPPDPLRVLAGLEYQPAQESLRLITLF